MIDLLQHLVDRFHKIQDVQCLEYIESLVRVHSSMGNHRELAYSLLYQFDLMESLNKSVKSKSSPPGKLIHLCTTKLTLL
jgi:hypothetical protein